MGRRGVSWSVIRLAVMVTAGVMFAGSSSAGAQRGLVPFQPEGTQISAAGARAPALALFGIDTVLGNTEHERMTRAALACGGGVKPPDCFQKLSLTQLAGRKLGLGGGPAFGAVGTPDALTPG